MSPYVWTDQAPRHEGMYWYREGVDGDPEIVNVYKEEREWCVHDGRSEDFVENYHGHWSTTPISPPREPVGNPFGT